MNLKNQFHIFFYTLGFALEPNRLQKKLGDRELGWGNGGRDSAFMKLSPAAARATQPYVPGISYQHFSLLQSLISFSRTIMYFEGILMCFSFILLLYMLL